MRRAYEESSPPEWVGQLEEEGQEPPPTMDGTTTTKEGPMEDDPEDIAEGTPLHPHTTEGVRKVVGDGG